METSPDQERNQFQAIARIVRAQGRKGEVIAEILTDFPGRFEELRRAYLERTGQAPEPVAVENTWFHKGRVVLKFSEVNSIDEAERLRGLHVLIPREDPIPLPAHQYYVRDLKGCRVVRQHQGKLSEVGIVTEVEPTGGVELLRVTLNDPDPDAPSGSGPREVLIPFAQDICTRIDPEAKIIVIDPPEDLLDLNP